MGVVASFLTNKCSSTEKDITKLVQKLEEVLELLNGCVLATLSRLEGWSLETQAFSYINLKDTWNRVLGAFRKKVDIIKLVYNNSKILNSSGDMLKPAISLLDCVFRVISYGSRGKAALFAHDSFGRKWIGRRFGAQEGICICFVCNIEGVGKENIGWKLRCLSSLSFSERHVPNLWRWQ